MTMNRWYIDDVQMIGVMMYRTMQFVDCFITSALPSLTITNIYDNL
jgi:hypothetical protein